MLRCDGKSAAILLSHSTVLCFREVLLFQQSIFSILKGCRNWPAHRAPSVTPACKHTVGVSKTAPMRRPCLQPKQAPRPGEVVVADGVHSRGIVQPDTQAQLNTGQVADRLAATRSEELRSCAVPTDSLPPSAVWLMLWSLPVAQVITQAALAEFRLGNPERGRSLFEGVLRNYPRRLDLWSVYLDQVTFSRDWRPFNYTAVQLIAV